MGIKIFQLVQCEEYESKLLDNIKHVNKLSKVNYFKWNCDKSDSDLVIPRLILLEFSSFSYRSVLSLIIYINYRPWSIFLFLWKQIHIFLFSLIYKKLFKHFLSTYLVQNAFQIFSHVFSNDWRTVWKQTIPEMVLFILCRKSELRQSILIMTKQIHSQPPL